MIAKTKYGLMRRLRQLENCFVPEKFERWREEFHKVMKIPDDDYFGCMDSDEAPYIFYAEAFPYIFYAEAFLSGYNEATKKAGVQGK